MNIYNSKEFQESLILRKKYFVEENLIETKELKNSYEIYGIWPEGFKFYKKSYKISEKNWNFTSLVIEYPSGESVSINRNYSSLIFFCFINNGKYYIATGIDYQGLTIYDIENKTQSTYIPERWIYGSGLCFTEFYDWDEDESLLYAEACIWGCEEEKLKIYIPDLTNLDTIEYMRSEDYYEED